jgi:hypothetical protein
MMLLFEMEAHEDIDLSRLINFVFLKSIPSQARAKSWTLLIMENGLLRFVLQCIINRLMVGLFLASMITFLHGWRKAAKHMNEKAPERKSIDRILLLWVMLTISSMFSTFVFAS